MQKLSHDIGLFQLQEEQYKEYIKRVEELKKANTIIESLQTEQRNSTIPEVVLEGKEDVVIFSIAREKLYPNQPVEYNFTCCDPIPEEGGAGGCDTLKKYLSTIRYNNPHVVIGVFDYDQEGIKAFNTLPKYFTPLGNIEKVKISKNRKAIAVLLPLPPEKMEYADYNNFCTEFYFSEEVLAKRTSDGKGLVFKQPDITRSIPSVGKVLETIKSNLPQTRKIISGKKNFPNKSFQH